MYRLKISTELSSLFMIFMKIFMIGCIFINSPFRFLWTGGMFVKRKSLQENRVPFIVFVGKQSKMTLFYESEWMTHKISFNLYRFTKESRSPTFTLMWESAQEKYVSQLYFILLFYVLFLQLRRGNSMMAAANSGNPSRFTTANTSRPNCPYVHCATTNG